MEPLTVAALAALVVKVVTVAKAVGKNSNVVATQVLTWIVGCVVVFLAAHADVTSQLILVGRQLGLMNLASQVLVGVMLSSFGSFFYDVKKAIDTSDSAAEPPLLPARTTPPG